MLRDRGLVRLANCTLDELKRNSESIERGRSKKLQGVSSAVWFLPLVTHALKGGVRTVFTVAEEFSRRWGALNYFVIYSHSGADFDVRPLVHSLEQHFPRLRFVLRKFRQGKDDINDLPRSEVAFCTLWTTAYLLLRYNDTFKKFYFMQDYEPLFYEAGSLYSVIEQTYRFGFSCIANTPGVGGCYGHYSTDVISFLPGVDKSIFKPGTERIQSGPFRVVFYGRPGNARNCFTLGAMMLHALKRKMGSHVQIISVGADWDVDEYGLAGVVENRGLLSSLEAVADLYQTSDVGLVFMVTPHPSYQPLEYMACGCVVATNINSANSWLLNDDNSLQLEPLPEVGAQRIHDLLKDRTRWGQLRDAGLRTVAPLSWASALSVVTDRVLSAS